MKDELGHGAIERLVLERKRLGRADPHVDAGQPCPAPRGERLGGIGGGHAIGTDDLGEHGRERARSAADVEDSLARANARGTRELARERATVAAHEALVGVRAMEQPRVGTR